MAAAVSIFFLLCIAALLYVFNRIRRSSTGRWLVSYIKRERRKKFWIGDEPVHLHVAFCNHLSPFRNNVNQEIAEHRIVTWGREYSRFASEHRDSQGRQPVHTFFYDESGYNPRFVDTLYKMCKAEIADVEILLRQKNDTSESFKRKLEGFRDVLFHHHGLLRRVGEDKIFFGFIYDGSAQSSSQLQKQFYDLKQKSLILKECGCYADFTFPSTPDTAQPPVINSIFFSDTADTKNNLYERGCRASIHNWSEEDLLIIQGPLGVNWRNRRLCLFPRIETGEISSRNRFTPHRAKLWLDTPAQIEGAPGHIFLKLHTYGAVDSTVRYLFGESGMHDLYGYLEKTFHCNQGFFLHYVSAYEMYRRVQAVCQGSPVLS
ncbi:MAG: hypothetical protein LBI42_02775 [Chitinispirillales bacterium]|jgi:hypothetical protein|nr:hypothetical protein [Chitinispirillales bacterium]